MNKKKKAGEYFFRKNTTNKEVYLQIWKRTDQEPVFIKSLGTASNLVKVLGLDPGSKVLVKVDFEDNQTKENL